MVSECLELTDEVARLAVLVEVVIVEVRTEVDETRVGVLEEVPGDDEYRSGDCDEGFAFAAAADETPVSLAQEGVGLAAAVAASPSAPLR